MPTQKHSTAGVPYHAFLVRCWKTEGTSVETPETATNENAGWSFVVVPIHNSTRAQGCNSWEELTAFLRTELAALTEAMERPADE